MGKFLCKLLCGIALFIAVERLCHKATDGFALARVRSDFSFSPAYVTQMQDDSLEEILSQPFHYLSSGSQCYVFKSEDGKTVLKLFKNHRFFNLASLFDEKRREKRIESFHDALTSCLFSHQQFQEHTAVFYVHLGRTETPDFTAHLVDKLGIHHFIDLNSVQFHLQSSATPVPDYLLMLRRYRMHNAAKSALDHLLEISEKRALLGYNDKDPHLIYNFGFIDGEAVQIDAVGFSKNRSGDGRRFYKREAPKIRAKVMPWIEKNYPEMVEHMEAQLNALSDNLNGVHT